MSEPGAKRIIVALDPSKSPLDPLRFGGELARRLELPALLITVFVHHPLLIGPETEGQREARAAAQQRSARARPDAGWRRGRRCLGPRQQFAGSRASRAEHGPVDGVGRRRVDDAWRDPARATRQHRARASQRGGVPGRHRAARLRGAGRASARHRRRRVRRFGRSAAGAGRRAPTRRPRGRHAAHHHRRGAAGLRRRPVSTMEPAASAGRLLEDEIRPSTTRPSVKAGTWSRPRAFSCGASRPTCCSAEPAAGRPGGGFSRLRAARRGATRQHDPRAHARSWVPRGHRPEGQGARTRRRLMRCGGPARQVDGRTGRAGSGRRGRRTPGGAGCRRR